MRARRTISALGIGLAIVFAADYATMAATGQSLVLGQVNKADETTVVTRTTPGTTMELKSQPGSAPLAVNRPVKVNKLNADLVDGVDSSALARRSTVSALVPPSCSVLNNVTSTFQKVADLGTFTKTDDASMLHLELITRLFVDGMTGTGTIFELRVDDVPTTVGTARALLHDAGKPTPTPFIGYFGAIPAGEHVASVWVKTNTGTATFAMIDPGCWNSQGVNQLFVTEFH